MGDPETLLVVSESPDSLQGMFGKSTHPRIFLRCMDRKTEMFVDAGMPLNREVKQYTYETDSGYTISTGMRTNVRFRFDEKKPVTKWMSTGDDGDSVFFSRPIDMIKQMLSAKRLLVEVEPLRMASQVASFELEGLAEAIKPLRGQCKW
jgi:type VI secretion system protein VasI